MASPNTVEDEVAALGGLTLSQLRGRWEQLYGSPPPTSLRQAFLMKACAYRIQAKAHGGLSAATKRRLRKHAKDISAGRPLGLAPTRRIKPGTRLVRAWGGAVHTVTVVPSGFDYAGERYRSLSAIAKVITGSNWNGPAFFGLEEPTRAAQGADKARRRPPAVGDGRSTACTGTDGPIAPAMELEGVEND